MTATTTPTEKAARRFVMPRLFVGLRGDGQINLPNEILAGVTLAALMIPLNIGYAQVAGLPPIVGLYTAIVPSLLWAIFSTSRHLVASPDAPIAALIGSLLTAMAAPGDPRYAQLAFAQALVCAVFFFLFWFFRLGFLANFLSKAVLVGFISGLGIEVMLSQIQKIMGVSIDVEGFFRELIATIAAIPTANLYAVALGLSTILIIRLLKRFAPRLPGPLIALVIMTAVVAFFNLDERGVSVLGDIPAGLPSLTIPQVSISDLVRLIPGALAIVGVTMAEGLLIARKFAQKYEYKIDPDQEMFAFGAANVAAGLTGGFAVGSSASRTAAMDSMGARSQIPSLVAAITVGLVVLFFADLLALLPNAVLGGIVANAVLALIEVTELRELFNMRRSEFWIAIICLVSVLVLGSLPAVIIAFLLSAIDYVSRAASPHTGVLTRSEDGVSYLPLVSDRPANQLPEVIVYRFGAPLFFANANTFREEVERLVEDNSAPVEWFILDAEAITDIDTTGQEALEQTIEHLKKKGITFAIARAGDPIPSLLKHYKLLELMGEDRVYPTNHAAVAAFARETGRPLPNSVVPTHEIDGD
jgi:high affinity sulfate transporter 1